MIAEPFDRGLARLALGSIRGFFRHGPVLFIGWFRFFYRFRFHRFGSGRRCRRGISDSCFGFSNFGCSGFGFRSLGWLGGFWGGFRVEFLRSACPPRALSAALGSASAALITASAPRRWGRAFVRRLLGITGIPIQIKLRNFDAGQLLDGGQILAVLGGGDG